VAFIAEKLNMIEEKMTSDLK